MRTAIIKCHTSQTSPRPWGWPQPQTILTEVSGGCQTKNWEEALWHVWTHPVKEIFRVFQFRLFYSTQWEKLYVSWEFRAYRWSNASVPLSTGQIGVPLTKDDWERRVHSSGCCGKLEKRLGRWETHSCLGAFEAYSDEQGNIKKVINICIRNSSEYRLGQMVSKTIKIGWDSL